ncbi:MAG: hypothetical protein OXF20_09720 [Gammaproteobacteria bacterium]|nr:hypothetical protein [Gammaproteobacteria bacterium]
MENPTLFATLPSDPYSAANELSSKTELFPAKGRLDETLKKPIADYLFAGATLAAEPQDFTTTLTFEIDGLSLGLPFLT